MSEAATLAAEPILPIVVGTAGHVDHGKSSLVRALTGIDPDRLKEEKARGLTIDIGFANFLHADGRRVGIVDVPGHERFIKNMVTGATGVDLVVLVVAADDGVMQQTREHLEILTLLGKQRGIIAITKRDLVDSDMLELAEADIREAVAGTFLQDAPAYALSNETGEGMAEFKAGLTAAIDSLTPHDKRGAFRLPVQRVFSAKGQGAVLTGIPLSGAVVPGDEVETLPSGQKGKIRSIQAYHGPREVAQAGHSGALNISSIDHKQVVRGHVVASPGYARMVSSMVAWVSVLERHGRPLEQGDEVKLLIDNSEVVGHVWIPGKGKAQMEPGSSGVVGIRLDEPIVPAVGDRFVLRLPSPAMTIGGGRVVSLSDENIRTASTDRIAFFRRKAESLDARRELMALTIMEAGPEGLNAQSIAHSLWLKREEVAPLIEELVGSGEIQLRFVSKYVHRDAWQALESHILQLLVAHHKAFPQSAGMKEAELQQKGALEPKALAEVLSGLAERGIVNRFGEVVCHSSHGAKLSDDQLRAMDKIRAALESAGFSPPTLEELPGIAGVSAAIVRPVTEYLLARGEAVIVGGEFLYASSSIARAVELSAIHIRATGDMKAGDFKNLLGTTRKFAIPLLEYLDGRGTFINRGGVRLLK